MYLKKIILLYLFLQTLQQTTAIEPDRMSNALSLDAKMPLVYNDENQTITARGSALLKSEDFFISAEIITWNKKKASIIAEQDVILSALGYRVLAESMQLDLNNGSFIAKNIKTGIYPWVIESQELQFLDDNFSFSESTVRHELKSITSPYLEVESIILDNNSSMISSSSLALKVGDYTLGKIPRMKFRTDGRKANFKLMIGERNPLGWYIGPEIHLFNKEWINSKAKILSYMDRGIYFAPSAKIYPIDQSHSTQAMLSLELGGIKDRGTKGADFLGNQIEEERVFARIYSINNFDKSWRFSFQTNPQSDSEIYRDFERDSFDNAQWVENFAELSYDGDFLSVSVLTDWQANKYESQVERKPQLQILSGPNSWWNKNFHDTVQLEYTNKQKKSNSGNTVASTEKVDFAYRTAGKFKLPGELTYLPHLTYRMQSYAVENASNPGGDFAEIGNELRYEIYSNLPVNEMIFNDQEITHIVSFNLTHTFVKELNFKNRNNIPSLEENIIDPNPERMELMDFLHNDDLKAYEVLNFGVDNSFLGNSMDGVHKEYISFRANQDLWSDEVSNHERSLYFYGIFDFYPHENLNFQYTTKINTSTGLICRETISAYIRDGLFNEYALSHLFFNNNQKNLQITSKHTFYPNKSLSIGLRYDPEEGNFPFWATNLEVLKRDGLKFRIYFSAYDGNIKEDELTWGLSAEIYNF